MHASGHILNVNSAALESAGLLRTGIDHPGIPLGTVFRGSFYYMPSYIVSIAILMVSPYWTVLVLSDLVK